MHGIRFQHESDCSCGVSFCWLTPCFPRIGGLFWSSNLKGLHVIKFSETWNRVFAMWGKANMPWCICTPVQRHSCATAAFILQAGRPSWWPWELKDCCYSVSSTERFCSSWSEPHTEELLPLDTIWFFCDSAVIRGIQEKKICSCNAATYQAFGLGLQQVKIISSWIVTGVVVSLSLAIEVDSALF